MSGDGLKIWNVMAKTRKMRGGVRGGGETRKRIKKRALKEALSVFVYEFMRGSTKPVVPVSVAYGLWNRFGRDADCTTMTGVRRGERCDQERVD